jgi:hypothetical protein
VHPLKASPFDPVGAFTKTACVKIEGGTDAYQQGNLKPVEILNHESFLLRRTESHPKNMRSGFVHPGYEFHFFFRVESSEGRRIRSNYFQSGESPLK